MTTLRARLLVLASAVVVVGAAAAWLLLARFTRTEVDRFVHAAASEQAARLAPALAAHHRARGGWAGVDSTLERMARDSGLLPAVVLGDGTVALPASLGARDARARPLPGGGQELSWRRDVGGRAEATAFRLFGGTPVVDGGRVVATLHLLPGAPASAPGPPASARFARGVNRAAAAALALAALAALAVALALARGVLGPLEALTGAVRGLDAGDLDARVPVRSRDEIGALAAAFNQMAERLSRTERLRRALVADVAHELRTPVTNLQAQLEAMQDGLERADGPALASLHEEVVHLGRLIDDLEDLAAADAGRLRIDPQPLDVHDALQRAVAALAPRAARAGVTVVVDAAPLLAMADGRRLGQVLRNLLDNAIAHTPAGGRITLSARRAEVAAGPGVAIAVADTGEGIPAEHLSRVFDRFHRVDPSRARETGGSGLGLAIVRQFVELIGGVVGAASAPGEGTTITFTLPGVTKT